jgi:hypothetical protein
MNDFFVGHEFKLPRYVGRIRAQLPRCWRSRPSRSTTLLDGFSLSASSPASSLPLIARLILTGR